MPHDNHCKASSDHHRFPALATVAHLLDWAVLLVQKPKISILPQKSLVWCDVDPVVLPGTETKNIHWDPKKSGPPKNSPHVIKSRPFRVALNLKSPGWSWQRSLPAAHLGPRQQAGKRTSLYTFKIAFAVDQFFNCTSYIQVAEEGEDQTLAEASVDGRLLLVSNI